MTAAGKVSPSEAILLKSERLAAAFDPA